MIQRDQQPSALARSGAGEGGRLRRPATTGGAAGVTAASPAAPAPAQPCTPMAASLEGSGLQRHIPGPVETNAWSPWSPRSPWPERSPRRTFCRGVGCRGSPSPLPWGKSSPEASAARKSLWRGRNPWKAPAGEGSTGRPRGPRWAGAVARLGAILVPPPLAAFLAEQHGSIFTPCNYRGRAAALVLNPSCGCPVASHTTGMGPAGVASDRVASAPTPPA